VTRVAEGGHHARSHLHGHVELDRSHQRCHLLGVSHGIERIVSQARGLARLAVPLALVLGVFFLEISGVEHHDATDLGRHRRAEDGPGEAIPHQLGQISAVIQVGVGQ